MLSYVEKLPASETKLHLQLVQEVFEPHLRENFDTIREVECTGHVAFKDLALVFVLATRVLENESDFIGTTRRCHLMKPSCKPASGRLVSMLSTEMTDDVGFSLRQESFMSIRVCALWHRWRSRSLMVFPINRKFVSSSLRGAASGNCCVATSSKLSSASTRSV
jgi:hypothetical protein